MVLLCFCVIEVVLCQGQGQALANGARRLQVAAGEEAAQPATTNTTNTTASTTGDTSPAPTDEAEVKKGGAEPAHPIAVAPAAPAEPEGPPPSEVYENIALNRYYHGSLVSNDTQTQELSAFRFPEWSPFAAFNEEDDRPWQYYSIDVVKELGDELEVKDQKALLSQLHADLKYANASQYQDLIVEVLEDGDESMADPNIYVMLSDELPTRTKHDLRCTFYGEDVCVISGQELAARNATRITLGVSCRHDCKFKLQAELEAEIDLRPGKMHNIYFKKDQQRIFRFAIPDSEDIDTIEIRGIHENKFAHFDMLMIQGNEVPDTSRALVLAPAWENGYIGKFSKHCYCFCTACNYTVLVSSRSDGYITIGAKISSTAVDLRSYPGGVAFDAVRYSGLVCYNYTVSDADKDFSVRLYSFAGDPDVYVNPTDPLDSANYTQAKFNSQEHFWNEELVLDPAIREEHGALTGPYFICVYGRTTSTYKITAKNEDHSSMLKAGLAEAGYLEHDQVKLYYYTDQSLMDANVKVKFDGHVMVGMVGLRIKLCHRPDDMSKLVESCNLTLVELTERDPDDKVMQQVGSETDRPDPNICSPNKLLRGVGALRTGSQAPCLYVVGVVGLHNYTSHYSVMVELQDETGSTHQTILSEGIPAVQVVKPKQPKHYTFSIDDPEIEQVTIQLTTLHGDPDIYVSTTSKTPNERDFERRSTNAGFYPDSVIFKKSANFNLTKDFYITVQSWQESSYSLTYYTTNTEGATGAQKLMVGQKQKGVLHINTNPKDKNMPILDQPSLVYHFSVPSAMLKDDKEVEIRLNAENGEFVYLVAAERIPDVTQLDTRGQGHWRGGQYKPVVITGKDIDEKTLDPVGRIAGSKGELMSFYIRVFPYVIAERLHAEQAPKPKEVPYTFDIAFYDEEQIEQLADGHPQRGVVSNQTFDYYFFDLNHPDTDYEITLSPISGGDPDLVISFDPTNKFPTKEKNDQMSAKQFITDSILLKKEDLAAFRQRNNYGKGELRAYIGVYTESPLSVYSIVATTRTDFSPIKLTLGQIQAGSVHPHEKKFFYVEASGESDQPFRIDLIPTHGNPDMEITIISDLSASKEVWQRMSLTPHHVSESSFGLDTVVLEPKTSAPFAEKCGESCILLIAVVNSQHAEATTSSHFRIQASQDFQELVENVKVEAQIHARTGAAGTAGNKTEQIHAELSRYKFFRFYKPCDRECDVRLQVLPLTNWGSVLSVLVNYQDPEELAQSVKLPTWQNKPAWTASLKAGSEITIEGDEPWFEEHHAKANRSASTSKGYFLIGVHSYSDITFSIAASTRVHDSVAEDGTISASLQYEQLFLGPQDKDILLSPNETRYFIFQNWRDESIEIQLQHHNEYLSAGNETVTTSNDKVVLELSSTAERTPRFEEQLPKEWLNANGTGSITVTKGSPAYCIFCSYVVKVSNLYESADVKFNIIVQQLETSLINNEIEKSFKGELRVGRPQPMHLEPNQISYLYFKADEDLGQIDIEVLLGSVKVQLQRSSDSAVLFEHPCPMNASHHLSGNIISFDLAGESSAYSPGTAFKQEYYTLKVVSNSSNFRGVAYLRARNSLELLSDGANQEFGYAFESKSKDINKPKYFMYLPSSHKFDLHVFSKMINFQSDALNLYDMQATDGLTKKDGLSSRLFNFKVSLKKLQLRDNLKGTYTTWAEEFTHDEQFDYVIHTDNSKKGFKMFKRLEFELDPKTDIILVKIDGEFDKRYAQQIHFAEIKMSFSISSSDVVYLAPNQSLKGYASADSRKYKIYEFYINKMQFPESEDGSVDLFVTLTPCIGDFGFYISDNIRTLFTADSQLHDHGYMSSLDIGKGDKPTIVRHKKSKVSADGTSREHAFEAKIGTGLDLDQYHDSFRIKGKRLMHMEKLDGEKLYIGVESLSTAKVASKGADGGAEAPSAASFSPVTAQFRPIEEAAGRAAADSSTFEISAAYIANSAPDFLDMYQLQDTDFGLRVSNAGGQGVERMMTISWSPILMLDPETFQLPADDRKYSPVASDIEYQLYLGFADSTIQMFSSLCLLEAADAYEKNQNNLRQLQIPHPEVEFEQVSPGIFVVKSFGASANVTIRGNNALKGLKFGVVLAHIFRQNEGQIGLAYAPVGFDQVLDFDSVLTQGKRIHIFVALASVVIFFTFLAWCCIVWSKRRNQANLEHEVAHRGISLQKIQRSSTMQTTTETSIEDTAPQSAAEHRECHDDDEN